MAVIVMRTRLETGNGYTFGFEETTTNNTVYNDGLQIPDSSDNMSWLTRANNNQPITTIWTGNVSDYYLYVIRHARWSSQTGFPSQPLFRVNGIDVEGVTSNSNIVSGDSSLVLGRKYDGGQWQHVSVSEMAIFNRILTTDELECVEEYLTSKWNI